MKREREGKSVSPWDLINCFGQGVEPCNVHHAMRFLRIEEKIYMV